MYNILLVEDDPEILDVNKKMLERRGGYVVRIAKSLAEARAQIAQSMPDIIVLDIMLPDGKGLDLLLQLRQTSDIPVLLLSALGRSEDVVRGLKSGGDDYLPKPYDNDVFLARLESLLRRYSTWKLAERFGPGVVGDQKHLPKFLAKGSLKLDTIAGRAFINDNDLLLTHKEFAILLLLANKEEETINAQSIYENVWKQPLGGNINTLQATISSLRKKIEPSGYTITVFRGQGYTFEQI